MKITYALLVFIDFALNTCQQDDYIALRALYLSTNGDNWTDNTGWPNSTLFSSNSTAPPSGYENLGDWYGITMQNGCVSAIYFSNNNLNGNIPPELGIMDNLSDLRLFGNPLSGSIPSELGDLGNLIMLGLTDNQLSGGIPPELGNLNNLRYLFLYINQLNGSIPPELGNLSNLNRVNLSSNQFSGSIPPELGNLSNLTELQLSGTQLTGNIPLELGSLTNLTDLILYNNQLSGSIPPEITNLSNLDFLQLSKNQLSGSLPVPAPGELANLTRLWIRENQLTGSIPPEFENLTNLESLQLNDNQLSGNISSQLSTLMNLSTIWLPNNQLSGSIPGEFGNLPNLTSLILSDNQLIGCYDTNLMNLCNQLTNSTNNNISNGNMLDADWEDFCNLGTGACTGDCQENDYVALRALYISTGGETWNNKSNWPDINDFMMNATSPPMGYEDLDQWYGVTTNADDCVTELILNNNNLNGIIPSELGNLGNLIRLEAKSNTLSGSIPMSFENLGSLNHLDLGNNELSGSIPAELASLDNLERIYLYSNNLIGNIPWQLADLGNLTHLGLNNNQLTGDIPAQFGDSNSLIYLHVANNKLSGCYDVNLLDLCTQLGGNSIDYYISRNNNFFATWNNFCASGTSACLDCVEVAPFSFNGQIVVIGPVSEQVAQTNREVIKAAIDEAKAQNKCISFPPGETIWIDYPLEDALPDDYEDLPIDPDGVVNLDGTTTWDDNNYIPMLFFDNFKKQIYFNQCTLKVNYFDLFMEYRNQLGERLTMDIEDDEGNKLATDYVTLDNCTPDDIWQDESSSFQL